MTLVSLREVERVLRECGLADHNLLIMLRALAPAPEARDGSIEHTLGLMESAKPVMLDEVAAARAELAALRTKIDSLRREAEMHAQEARTQRATVHEIYQLVTGRTGEPGDWNGAEPVRAELAQLRQRAEDLEMMLRKALDYGGSASLRRHGDRIVFVPDIGAPIYLLDDGTGLPKLDDAARRALTQPKETK